MTEKACSRCKKTQPLHAFRRWRGRKRAMHSVCSTCEPEKNLSQMSPKARINASAAGRPGAHIAVVLGMNQREADHLRYSVRPERALRQHRATRREAWKPLHDRVHKEHEWARRALASAQAAGEPGAAWAAFFSAYVVVLADLRARYAVKHLEPGPRKITMDDHDPATHITRALLARLRMLYGECRPIPGRRMYRDPWCLSWGQSDPA